MLQTTKPFDASAPQQAGVVATVVILLAGVVAAGLRPVPALAQEDTVQALDEQSNEQSEEESIRATIQTKFDRRKWSDLTEAERVEFASLVNRLYEKDPDDSAVKNLYADFLIASGDLVKAMPVLRDLFVKNPLRGLQAAAVARRLKRFDEADAIAKRALDAMKKMSDQDPANLSVSLAIAQNQLFLKRYDDSIETLDKAIKLAKSPQEIELARQAYGDAVVANVRHLQDNSGGSVALRIRVLKLVRDAAEITPKNPSVMTTIANLLQDNRDVENEEVAAIRTELQAALDEFKENEAK